MQPTIGNVNDGSVSLGTTLSVALTVTTGNLLIAMVGCGVNNPSSQRTPSGVTFNGGATAMTRLGAFAADDGNFERIELFYYLNPPAGALTLVASLSAGGQIGMGIFEVLNADLVALFETPVVVNNNTTGSTIATSALTPTVDQIVLLGLATDDDTGGTIDNGGSSIWEELSVNTDSGFEGALYNGTGASLTPEWSALGGLGGAVAAVILNGPVIFGAPPPQYPSQWVPSIQQRMG